MEHPIRELIRRDDRGDDPSGEACDAAPCVTDVGEPVVIFHHVPVDRIKALIREYKRDGLWPICAVVTPASLDMLLSTLIEHLVDDRSKESALRQQRKSGVVASP